MDGVKYNPDLEEETTFINGEDIQKSGQNSEFDDLFETLGDLGFYQLLVYVMANVMESSGTLSVMYFIFECADPGWKCASIECENSCVNSSMPNSTDGFCTTEDLVCINRTFNPTLTSALTEWSLVCGELWKAKTIISIFFVALAIGSIAGGQVSDTFGRRCFFPESSRWLVQKRRFKDAEYWIRKAIWFNRLSPEMDLHTFLENVARTENKRQERTVPYTYLDLFHNRKMTIWTIVLIYASLTLAIAWYGINSSISSLTGNIYLNVAVAGVGEFVVGYLSIYVINWIGRVKSYVLFISLTGCCHIVILTMKVTGVAHSNPMVVTYFSLASISVMAGGWCAVGIACWELYPTLMR
ncbi:solute carrier family 22 member 15-like [Tubulanus polymorphus]|uniref:solute carrier family 22 member 15-like n=1 Tax=Tubulanus polymorphus TaxID=672921 RepID=UPI003DA28D06